MSSTPAAKVADSSPGNDTGTTSSTPGPNRPRRRPRKLNKEPAPEVAKPTPTIPNETPPPVSTVELEALKSRVRGLEAKVEELYHSGAVERNGRSPRRRGKGRKGSAQQIPTVSTTINAAKVEDEEEADEELGRLEDELEVARRDLETYRPRPRTKRTSSGNSEYIEEIPRDEPGVEDMINTGDRQVTLTGSYRIPLPATVSMSDVKNIQSGVSAAQNVAKSFLEQRRAAQAVQDKSKLPTPKPRKQSTNSTTSVMNPEDDKQTWSEWFGGYSVAISRAMKNVEAEAALENQKRRPAQTGRTASVPSTAAPKTTKAPGKAPTKPTTKKTGTTAKGDQRPPMKQRGGNLSSEQVHGLMG